MSTSRDPLYRRHRFPPEVISYAIWLYFRFPFEPSYGRGNAGGARDLRNVRDRAPMGEEVRQGVLRSDPPARARSRRQMAYGWCVTNTFLKEEVGGCTRDEGGPLEASGQARPQTPASCDRQERWW